MRVTRISLFTVAMQQPRECEHQNAEIAPGSPRETAEEEADRCSYEEQRERRVARVREMTKPVLLASKT